MQLRKDNVRVLGPAAGALAISSFLEQCVAVAIAKGIRSAILDRRATHVSWVSLPHSECEVHIAVLLFGTCCAA